MPPRKSTNAGGAGSFGDRAARRRSHRRGERAADGCSPEILRPRTRRTTARAIASLSLSLLLLAACDSGGRSSSTVGEIPGNETENFTGRIGDFVWHDQNRDGIQQAGEPGLDGVTVALIQRGVTIGTAVTETGPMGRGGYYEFTGLPAGTYTVDVVAGMPGGFTPTGTGATEPTSDSNELPATVILAADDSADRTIDFGFISPEVGQIGDFVWHDLDCDGIQDPEEGAGIDGVTVTLQGAGAPRTTTTSGGGRYRFTGLAAGTYTVTVDASTLPPNFVPAPAMVGGDPAADSDASPATVTIGIDETDPTIDFGYCCPAVTGTIGDFVWNDENGNGIQDGEPGIENVHVVLEDLDGNVLCEDWTGRNGLYRFTGVAPGDYRVVVDERSLPSCFAASPCRVGNDPQIDNDCSPARVTMPSPPVVDLSVDFGFRSTGEGSIGDFVWDDRDCDGIQDPGEPGLPWITVVLEDEHGTTIAVERTNERGYYTFECLPAGRYWVEVDETTLPPCFSASPCNLGPDRAVDSNCSPAYVTLGHGEHDDTIDFGFISHCEYEIGDFVWHDENGDGLQTWGEPGIEGVEVILEDDYGRVLGRTWTDEWGAYEFRGLDPGEYVVKVDSSTLPAGFVPTLCDVGGDDSIDNDCSPEEVSLPGYPGYGETIDFGYRRQAAPGPPGCSPEFWRDPYNFGHWPPGLWPQMPFDDVFEDAFPGRTLVEVLAGGGSALDDLGRHAVAALLNAESPAIGYAFSRARVVELFDAVYPGRKYRYRALKWCFAWRNWKACRGHN